MVEGESVFEEAILFLSKLNPLEELKWSHQLFEAALEHVIDIGPKGLLSYQSSDGTEPEDRISKHGQYVESLGENIDFGPNDALGVLVSLTLDDGESERPHRENLFKDEYHKVGIACGPHSTEYQMCVMDFAFDFKGFDMNNEDNGNVLEEHSKDFDNNFNNNFMTDQNKTISNNYDNLNSNNLNNLNSNKVNNFINLNSSAGNILKTKNSEVNRR